MLTDTKTLIARFERQAHRMGELWERFQGKGWPDAESAEFTALRDERLPAMRAALEAIESAACAPLLERIAELETEVEFLSGMQGTQSRREAKLAQQVPDGVTVSRDFIRGFRTLVHNYSLRAEAPDYYRGTEADAFSNAYARCGRDLAEVDKLLTAAPAAPEQQEPTKECWCESCDLAKGHPMGRTRMSVCPQCGDKRCPRAKHHDSACQVAQASNAQHADPAEAVMRPMEFEDGRKGWYVQTPYFYCDIEPDETGVWSVFFRAADGKEAFGEMAQQAKVQPVGTVYRNSVTGEFELLDYSADGHGFGVHVDIYTAPPKAVPLADEQAMAIAGEIFPMSQLANAAAYHTRLCEVYGIGAPAEKGGE